MTQPITVDGSKLTVVMYHYVRPVAASAYPRLKALELEDFLAQIDYLRAQYSMISPQDLRHAMINNVPLPPAPCLLTFDDGYSDHYAHVYPALKARGLTGLFFAPYQSLVDRRMLDVNKVQFVLANAGGDAALDEELDAFLQRETALDVAALRHAHMQPNRYDSAPVAYFKRLLQHVLPADIRRAATDDFFARHVSTDQASFATDLYLTPDQARDMRATGMEFGGHGRDHLWHAQSDAPTLQREIQGSVEALTLIGAPVKGGFYCYPFGSHNVDVCTAVRQAGFDIGFTVEPHLVPATSADPLRLSRLDTNDLPKSRTAQNDPWHSAAQPLQGHP